jgi:glycosyltransferase involved in cell wall biosynthesis
MRLIYVLDYCFQQTPDGAVWTDTSYSAAFWEPYLDVYEEINLVCRTKLVQERNPSWHRVNNSNVIVSNVVNYSGAWEYAVNKTLLQRQLDLILSQPGVVMLRMPSNLARCAAIRLNKVSRGYGVDVVGDPWCAMAPGVVTIRGRAFFRWLFTRAQKTVCSGAMGASYVASSIASKYPTKVGAQTLICSDVRLDKEWLLDAPREAGRPARRLVTVATLSQVYKGIDILLRAIAMCKSRDLILQLTIVGTGRYRESLEQCTRDLGIEGQVTFRGAIPWGPKLMEEFDRADVFVLPSLVEVMPRALLEAMARGLPCIATRVGAVAEVIPGQNLVEPRDAESLSNLLSVVVGDPLRMKRMSKENLQMARSFESRLLMPRWLRFHRDLCYRTASKERASKSLPLLREPDLNRGFEERLPGEQIDAARP